MNWYFRIIWNKYCEFENKVGDLTSLLKIENRRKETFTEEYEGKVTCLLVDRLDMKLFDSSNQSIAQSRLDIVSSICIHVQNIFYVRLVMR